MTSLMRAVAPQHAGPKVLRIGLVQSGRVVEERIMKQRATVSIGPSESATFVMSKTQDLDLFQRVGDGYVLNFTHEMTGRMVCEDGVKDLAVLRARATRVGRTYQLVLGEDSRGKVVVGESTFLFQFVDPPPAAARAQLPLSVKATFGSQIDWALTMIAAFSFMLHFGAIGAMYSDWSDHVVNEDVTVQGLADMLNNVPAPIAEEPIDTTTPTQTPNPSTPAPPHPNDSHANANNAQPGRMTDQHAASLSNRAEAMEMDLIGSMTSETVMVGVRNRSEAPINDLTAAANSPGGTRPGTELDLSHSGGITQPGFHRDLTDFGNTHVDAPGQTVHTEVAPPPSFAQIDPIPATPNIPHAEATIAQLRSGYRSCYNKGLNDNAQMAGKIVLLVSVQPNGDVQNVTKADGSGLSSGVEQCIIDRTKHASFEQGSGGTLRVPVSFYTQK